MAKRRIGVGFTGMGDALSMLCLRYDEPAGRDMAVRIARCMRDAAYGASVALAREKGAFPTFDAAAVPGIRHLRQPAGRAAEDRDPRTRHPQQPPAVDRAHGHRQPGLRRQRLQRHRAGLLLDLHAPQARGRRQRHRIRRRRPRLAPVPHPRRRHGQAAAVFRFGDGDAGGRPRRDDGGGAALRGHRDFQDRERVRGLSLRGFQGPLSRGLEGGPEGPRHLPAQQHRRRGAAGRRRQSQQPKRSRLRST